MSNDIITNKKRLTQGQSQKATETKLDLFIKVIHQNLIVFRNKYQPNNRFYYHFDMNCGCGYNEKIRLPGSPVLYLNKIEELKIKNHKAFFIDQDKEACAYLLNANYVRSSNDSFVFNGDNSEFIYLIPDIINYFSGNTPHYLGSIFIDPNGPSNMNIEALGWLSKICKNIDVIINVNTNAQKRVRNAFLNHEENRLSYILNTVKKRYWHIQEDTESGQQFRLLVGRNIAFSGPPPKGLARLGSNKGRKARLDSELTKIEKKRFGFDD